jgi:hypothetical protein
MRREVLTARTYRAIGDEKSALAANGATRLASINRGGGRLG